MENQKAALLPIAKQLKDSSPKVRCEAICALEKFAPVHVSDPVVVNLLTQATTDKNIEVRERCEHLLANIGIRTTRMPWDTGAATWKEISDAFVRVELRKPSADFSGLGERLQVFSAEQRHGAWVYVAEKLGVVDKTKSMRCYIEALHNDPDPNSVAWGWLNGSCDTEMNALPPVSPKTLEVVEGLRHKLRPITEK
jgi:hypothetical protein